MADVRTREGQEGTTLVELLVVILLLGIIGTVTTVGIITSFRTQLAATQGTETLDELRLSVQRMRDVIRGADEVCATSTATLLAVWTDRHDAGVLGEDEDVEVYIFEVDPVTSQLTGRVRNSGTATLISDVIVTAGGNVFSYNVAPTAQGADLVCDGTSVTTPGTSDTTRVELDIEVQNADGVNTVETTTSMRLRNAGLADVTSGGGAGTSNDPPTASLDNLAAQCKQNEPCLLDGEGTDPESGPLTFEWDLDGDAAFDDATGEDPTHTFTTTGFLPVALRVTDDQGQSATDTATIEIVPEDGNLAPIAAFNYRCDGATCFFDADDDSYPQSSESGARVSSDAEDAQGDLTYDWTFQPQGVPSFTRIGPDQTESFSSSPTTVTLRVTDTEGGFDESTVTISTSPTTIHVASLKAVGSNPDGSTGTFVATLTVEVKTTAGVPRDDVQVSVDIDSANQSVGTCSTGNGGISGKCDISVTAPKNNTVTFRINTLSDSGGAEYDAQLNVADEISVSKNQTSQEP